MFTNRKDLTRLLSAGRDGQRQLLEESRFAVRIGVVDVDRGGVVLWHNSLRLLLNAADNLGRILKGKAAIRSGWLPPCIGTIEEKSRGNSQQNAHDLLERAHLVLPSTQSAIALPVLLKSTGEPAARLLERCYRRRVPPACSSALHVAGSRLHLRSSRIAQFLPV